MTTGLESLPECYRFAKIPSRPPHLNADHGDFWQSEPAGEIRQVTIEWRGFDRKRDSSYTTLGIMLDDVRYWIEPSFQIP